MTDNYLTFVPAYTHENGRRIHRTSTERARLLQRPGETLISLTDLAEYLKRGYVPVALIWHGERGSGREAWGRAEKADSRR